MLEFDILTLALLFGAAFLGGFIDSIAGGGGSITLPALLLSGISPLEALATNKLQGVFGSFSATRLFYKKGYINLKKCLPFAILAFAFSALGTISVQFINSDFLSKFLPFFIILFGFYFLFSPKIKEEQRATRFHKAYFLFALAGIGFYDGFLGPGTGSFLLLALIVLAGYGLTNALGEAKLYNFATNLASVVFFAIGGNMLFGVGLMMALGQFIGANLGSRAAIRYGIKIIKPLIVIVSFAMAAKLLYEQF
ncbi:TSUP family transporter [Helicobacter pullorum]|uniref:Probable membrane transporter protein n=1 Tax=Helicobacter pullorum TaxID=35818 RepID=A0A377Q0C4_9HELI|nr:TSUP family transporter [Helicobacter pullorum]STQ87303.1 putative permease [Helicobacter pullorum]